MQYEAGPPGAPVPTLVPLSELMGTEVGFPVDPIYGQVGGNAGTMIPYGQTDRRPTMHTSVSQTGGDYSKDTHIPLAKCRVLYLGSAVPLETSVGLEAVQNPLRERYAYGTDGDVAGIDAWLTVFSSGVLLQYVGDKSSVWFPIQTLHVCAAVKCSTEINGLTGDKTSRFVALDSPAGKNSRHPPIFASIMRRTQGVKVLECHGFICKSNQAALALVHSCTHAFDHKEGWTDDAPNGETINSRLVAADPVPKNVAPPEFFEKPPPQGYFYTSNKGLIRNYNVFGNQADEYKRVEYPAPSEAMRRPSRALPAPEPQRGPPSRMEPLPRPQLRSRTPPGREYYDPPPPIFMPSQIQPIIQPEMVIPPPPAPQFFQTFDPYFANPPPAPEGYFSNWDNYGGQPVALFPNDPYQGQVAYEGRPRRRRTRRRRKSRSPPRQYPQPYGPYGQPPMAPQPPPPPQIIQVPVPVEVPVQVPVQVPVPVPYEVPVEVEVPKPVYLRSYSPARTLDSYYDYYDYYDYDDDDYDDYNDYTRRQPVDRRARRDDYDQRSQARDPPRRDRYNDPYSRDDLMMYAPRYMRSIPDEGRRRPNGPDYAEYNPRNYPDIRLKESRDYRREREYDPYGRGGGRDYDDRDYGNPRDYDRGNNRGYDQGDNPYNRQLPDQGGRRYPRGDQGFARSIGEERRVLGDGYADPYDLNDPRRNYYDGESVPDYDMFRGRPTDNLDRTLGYLP